MRLLSEDHILALVAQHFPAVHPSILLSRGDDCAVLQCASSLCVSSDLFLEDIHFRRAYFSPAEAGHKALAVNISDIAAMGARPVAFTLCLGLTTDVDVEWLNAFFAGMARLAEFHRMALAGGDLSRSERLHVCITVWGESVTARTTGSSESAGSYLTRGGALPGDSLFLVGPVGLARVGLAMLEALGHQARIHWPDACAALLTPTPLVDAGSICARAGLHSRPPALMDISDGLARDVPRLLGITGERLGRPLGAHVVLHEAMLPPEVIRYAREYHKNPVTEAWLGGEDYALLGACAPELLPTLHAALPELHSLGTVTGSGRIFCNGQPADAGDFDHFGQGAQR